MKYYSAKEIATGKECLVAKCDFDELPREKAIKSLLDMGVEVDTNKIIVEDNEPEMGSAEYFDQYDCWDAIGGDWEG